MKKILFSDMDGTIINEKEVKHPRDKEMLEELQKQGHLIAFNTGRNFQEALFSVESHQFPYDYLVLNNGAHIVSKDGKELFKKMIPGDVGKHIIEYCMKIEGLWVFFYNGFKTFGYYNGRTYEHTENGMEEIREYDFCKEYLKATEYDIIAINQEDGGIKEILEVQAYIQDHFGKDATSCLNVRYLDITAAGCSKGSGVLTLNQLLNEEVETYCIGDSFNDISMFEVSDYAYTFHDVSKEIHQHASKQVGYVYHVVEDMLGGESK